MIALFHILHKCMLSYRKKRVSQVYLPPPCFTVVTDEDEDTAEEDDCWWLLTISSLSFTAGVAGQIATCGTSRTAGGGACCFGLVGCGGNSPDFVAWMIAVPLR